MVVIGMMRARNLALQLSCIVFSIQVRGGANESPASRVVGFEFESGLDDWGAAATSSAGMSSELVHNKQTGVVEIQVGAPRGTGGSSQPAWVDGPDMHVLTTDSTYVLLRMKHRGSATSGALWFRAGSSVAPSATSPDPTRPDLGSISWLPGSSAGQYWERTFDVVPNGKWRVYAIPLSSIRGAEPTAFTPLSQLRLFPALRQRPDGMQAAATPLPTETGTQTLLDRFLPAQDTSVFLDFIRIVHAPTIYRVAGCGYVSPAAQTHVFDQYFPNVTAALRRSGAHTNASAAMPFARTYNCAARGGDVITITGTHFGPSTGGRKPSVWIDGALCTNVEWIKEEEAVQCTTPARPRERDSVPAGGVWLEADSSSDVRDTAVVTICHAQDTILTDSKPFLRWASPAVLSLAPVVTNVAARSMDVQWLPSPDSWQAITVTGYQLDWRMAAVDDDTVENTSPGCADAVVGTTPGTGQVLGVHAAGIYADLSTGIGNPASYPGSSARRVYVENAVEEGIGAGAVHGAAAGTGALAGRTESSVVWGLWGSAPGGGSLLTGNQTYAVVRGLEEGRRYQFRVRALTEPLGEVERAYTIDGYNVRQWKRVGGIGGSALLQPPTPFTDMVVGPSTAASCDARTLAFDALFTHFDANKTLDHGPAWSGSSLGPGGWVGGEGHYGIVLVGSAHIANCNATHVCCDGFGGSHFNDIVRFLDGWSGSEWPRNTSMHGSCSDGDAGQQPVGPSPLYRYNANTGDYSPVHMDWSNSRTASDGLDAANAHGVLNSADLYAQGVAETAGGMAGVGGVASAGTPVLHRGRLSGSPEALLGRALGRAGTGTGKEAGSGSWFSMGGSGRASGVLENAVWDGYDDAGTLVFVSNEEIALLDAQARLDADSSVSSDPHGVFSNGTFARGVGEYVPPGVQWAGRPVPEARVLANETAWNTLTFAGQDIGVLPGEYRDASARRLLGAPETESREPRRRPGELKEPIPGPTREDEEYGRASVMSMDDAVAGSMDGEDIERGLGEGRSERPQHGLGQPQPGRTLQSAAAAPTFTAPSRLNFTRPVLRTCGSGADRRFVHRDVRGRRLVGLAADPAATCTAVCTGLAGPRPPVLNGAPQTSGVIYPHGMLGGPSGGTPSTYGTTDIPETGRGVGKGSARGTVTDALITGRVSQLFTGQLLDGPGQPSPSSASTPVSHVLHSNTTLGKEWGARASAPCGPALRITGSHGNSAGAAWYGRAVHVTEGFDSMFVFRLSNPSSHCRNLHDVATRCVSRGGGGMAFVVQTDNPAALGASRDSGLGYAGLQPSLAVEFDTWADAQSFDPHENHVSVHTRGAGVPNSGNHTASLGHAPRGRPLPDLTAGIHVARVLYEPRLRPDHVDHPAFAASGHFTSFMHFRTAGSTGVRADNADTGSEGYGTDWGWAGSTVGALSVFLDDESHPVLIVPLDMRSALALDEEGSSERARGRAWIGFTAATGADVWQTHDVLAWHFTALREGD